MAINRLNPDADRTIVQAESCNFYWPDGRPARTVVNKQGKEVKVTLTHARKYVLVPSVTTYLKVLAKPQLVVWMCDQRIRACAEDPFKPGEDIKEYIERIEVAASEYAEETAEQGKAIHAGIRDFLVGDIEPVDGPCRVAVQKIWEHIVDTCGHNAEIIAETSFCNTDSGIAMTPDLIVKPDGKLPVFYDFKTRDFRGNPDKVEPYTSDGFQLAGYKHGYGADVRSPMLNAYIDRETGDVKFWPHEDNETQLAGFLACKKLWEIANGYAFNMADHQKING